MDCREFPEDEEDFETVLLAVSFPSKSFSCLQPSLPTVVEMCEVCVDVPSSIELFTIFWKLRDEAGLCDESSTLDELTPFSAKDPV